MRGAFVIATIFFAQMLPAVLHAQSSLEVPRYELGLQLNFTYLDGVGVWGGGIGGRFHYNFNEHVAFDSEVLFRQNNVPAVNASNPTPIVAQTTGLFGVRAGQRFENGGLFVHARGGFLHFGNDGGATLLTKSTVPAFDVGMTLERYFGPAIFRFDAGEMIVPYGNATLWQSPLAPQIPPPGPLGTRANPSVEFGIAFRF